MDIYRGVKSKYQIGQSKSNERLTLFVILPFRELIQMLLYEIY